MNIQLFQKQLREKETVLLADIARLEKEAQSSGGEEVRDATDDAASSEETSESLSEAGMASETLHLVQDALGRIEEGSYGKCVVCGKQIEPARLKAVPWTPYCLEDQERQEQIDHTPDGGSTL